MLGVFRTRKRRAGLDAATEHKKKRWRASFKDKSQDYMVEARRILGDGALPLEDRMYGANDVLELLAKEREPPETKQKDVTGVVEYGGDEKLPAGALEGEQDGDAAPPPPSYESTIRGRISTDVDRMPARKVVKNAIGQVVTLLNDAFYASLPTTSKNAVDQASKYVTIGKTLYDHFFRKMFKRASGAASGAIKASAYTFAISDKQKLAEIVDPEHLELEFGDEKGKCKITVKVSNAFPVYIQVLKGPYKARFIYDATVLREFEGEWVQDLNIF